MLLTLTMEEDDIRWALTYAWVGVHTVIASGEASDKKIREAKQALRRIGAEVESAKRGPQPWRD